MPQESKNDAAGSKAEKSGRDSTVRLRNAIFVVIGIAGAVMLMSLSRIDPSFAVGGSILLTLWGVGLVMIWSVMDMGDRLAKALEANESDL